ncbi:MAG: hypothetical protein NW241_17620 [Bacteroidia bacterium]|nr:hypothetical protein [Bacteroidia bacterium]
MDLQHTPAYPHFAPDQVLTDSQLNGLRRFLDEQNRLTRTHGIGAGIVCGLKAAYRYGAPCDEHYIVLSPGYGFTSAGYLMQMEAGAAPADDPSPCVEFPFKGRQYTHVRPYHWNERDLHGDGEAMYQAWRDCQLKSSSTDTSNPKEKKAPQLKSGRSLSRSTAAAAETGTPLTSWELLTADEGIQYAAQGAVELTELHVSGHVLVLFLEKGGEEDKPCIETDCSRNSQTVYRIRALLVPEACYTRMEGCQPLDLLHVPRLHTAAFAPPVAGSRKSAAREAAGEGRLSNLTDYQSINRAYGSIVEGLASPELQQDGQHWSRLTASIAMAYQHYADFLCLDRDAVDIAALKARLDAIFQGLQFNLNYHQYHYDFLRDLVRGYNEFIAEACRLTGNCWPVSGFPRHLGIAHFVQTADQQIETLEGGYRTGFYPAPVRNVMHGDWQRVRRLFLRLRDMIQHFAFDHGIVRFASDEYRETYDIRITPSQTEAYPLGRRAIPYYYDLTRPGALEDFARNWQPADCCTDEALLGYHLQAPDTEPADPYGTAAAQADPLRFSILGNGFFRIEGHIGMPCEAAEEALDALRIAHNLEFDLIFVHLHERKAGQNETARGVHQADSQTFFKNIGSSPAVGMEHMGGVPAGGTFIVICDEVCTDADNPKDPSSWEVIAVADFALHRSLACCLEDDREEEEPDPESPNDPKPEIKTRTGRSVRAEAQPAGIVAKPAPAGAALEAQLQARSVKYQEALYNLNAKGEFAKSALYADSLEYVSGKQPGLDAYRELSGKILQTYARSKDADKKRAYAHMLETLTLKAFDASLAGSWDEAIHAGLGELSGKLKTAGLSLSRIRTNWNAQELPAGPARDALLNLFES